MTAWRTEVTFEPHPDLPPLRMDVTEERVTPGPGRPGYAPAFAAWCRKAAAAWAARDADDRADAAVERLRPRLEASYGNDFAARKLHMLRRYGALIDAALAASLEDAVDDEGAA